MQLPISCIILFSLFLEAKQGIRNLDNDPKVQFDNDSLLFITYFLLFEIIVAEISVFNPLA